MDVGGIGTKVIIQLVKIDELSKERVEKCFQGEETGRAL